MSQRPERRKGDASVWAQLTVPDNGLAASYASGIIQNHSFLDGNKRTGFMLAAVFLEINGLTLSASKESVVMETFALAAGESGEEEYSEWLGRTTKAT